MKTHLNKKSLITSTSINSPKYNRDDLKEKWIHIGLGNFHRSHQAFYLHNLLQKNKTKWSIIGLEIKKENTKLINNLNQQDCLYTLITKDIRNDQENNKYYLIGSITSSYIVNKKNIEIVNKKIIENDIEIISLTITENGYYEKDDQLDLSSDNIISDIKNDTYMTIYGLLYELISKKFFSNGKSFSILSCDNIIENGDKLSKYFFEFCEKKKSKLINWIKSNVAFPNTMVDRITPKYDIANTDHIEKHYNYLDKCVVESEPHIQWIVEKKFKHFFPNLESIGVNIVNNVQPYQKMKMRMLNASHCSTSFLGSLIGFQYVHQTFNNEIFCKFIECYLDKDVIPFLKEDFYDYNKFKKNILKRFSNTALKDTIERTTINGSKNLEIFIRPSFLECSKSQKSTIRFALIYSSWLVFIEKFIQNSNTTNLLDENILLIREIMSKDNYIEFFLNNSSFLGIYKLVDKKFKHHFYDIYNLLKQKKFLDAIRYSIE